MSGTKRILKSILLLPIVLLVLFILFELIGMTVNHTASARQTRDLIEILESSQLSVEIVDSYTETGNTSGTGNHVDMLSAIVFRSETELVKIEQVLQKYDALDEWAFWVEDMDSVMLFREKYPGIFPFLNEMNLPVEPEHCWLLYRNVSAPFPSNIEGH